MLYAAKLKTMYVGTDSEVVFEAVNEQDAMDYAWELACDNANSYFEVVPDEDFTEDMDDRYVSTEDIHYTLFLYDPDIHAEWDRA